MSWKKAMVFYEMIPDEYLICFYDEIQKNIEKGKHSKRMYYELAIIISVANRRKITLPVAEITAKVLEDLNQ